MCESQNLTRKNSSLRDLRMQVVAIHDSVKFGLDSAFFIFFTLEFCESPKFRKISQNPALDSAIQINFA
ncbi:hypothetical protein ACWIUD_02165 [Helicobacter sp. 23-1044]